MKKAYEEAIKELELASKQAPDDARYAYVLGVALYDSGQHQQGLRVLRQALARHPNDTDLINAVAAYTRSPPN